MTDTLLTIRTLGQLLDDLERVRIMNSNRIAAIEREHGEAPPHLAFTNERVREVEHEAVLELQRAWRKHPLAPWAKAIPGCGEKLIARLIAEIGDPADPERRPNPGKLLAYCGHGDPHRKRAKGMTQEEAFALGNPHAKKRVWLLASQFCKTMNSPYRLVYEEARERYADRTHEAKCVRCGPAGKPALPGSEWSLGHQHAAALRLVGKRFLIDLWKEARAGQPSVDAQLDHARAGHARPDAHTTSARAGEVLA